MTSSLVPLVAEASLPPRDRAANSACAAEGDVGTTPEAASLFDSFSSVCLYSWAALLVYCGEDVGLNQTGELQQQ